MYLYGCTTRARIRMYVCIYDDVWVYYACTRMAPYGWYRYDTACKRWVGSSAEEQSAFNRLVVGSSPTQPKAVNAVCIK